MQVTISATKVKKWVIELGAVAAVVVPQIESVPVPSNVRPVIAGVGGLILAITHYLTGAATQPTTTTATAAPVTTTNAYPPATAA